MVVFFFSTKSALQNMGGLQLPFQVIIIISVFGKLESAARPVVTFYPEWNKILLGQSITMSCNVNPEALSYHWYHNNREISTEKNYIIPSAEIGHSGEYKCRASTGGTSEIVTLSVSVGLVVLQAPLYIYEGDNIDLRCHSPPERPTTQTTFYKNNQMIQQPATNYDRLPIKYTDLTATYRCSKQLWIANTYSAETNISYTEGYRTIGMTITPDWNKLLTGESMTMTCHGVDYMTYQWLQNDIIVAEGRVYTITSAQVGHSGIYQCQTRHGHTLPFRLDVSDGPLILQAPVFVYRGTNINLNCHSRPGYSVHSTTFYKDNTVISGPSSYLNTAVLYGEQGDVSGRYRCERELSRGVYATYTDEVSLHVRELFSKPIITLHNTTTMLHPMTEGDNMTLTCDTSLSPLRQGTELQFAFYRDGEKIQKFTSSHQYEIYSAHQNDSGNYYCEVRTPTNSVIKKSEEFYIQIQGGNQKSDYIRVNIIRLVLSGCVLVIACVFLIHHIKTEVITPSKG